MPIDGVSLAYTFAERRHRGAEARAILRQQRAAAASIDDGWFAGTFGPFIPWDTPGVGAAPRRHGMPTTTSGSSTTSGSDFSQAHELAAEHPEKLAEMKARFLDVAEANKDFPIGAGSGCGCIRRTASTRPTRAGRSGRTTARMPEFAAPASGGRATTVTIEAEIRRERRRRALRASAAPAAGSRSTWTRAAGLRIQHDDHRALSGRATAKLVGRQAHDRRRHGDRQAGRAGRGGHHR